MIPTNTTEDWFRLTREINRSGGRHLARRVRVPTPLTSSSSVPFGRKNNHEHTNTPQRTGAAPTTANTTTTSASANLTHLPPPGTPGQTPRSTPGSTPGTTSGSTPATPSTRNNNHLTSSSSEVIVDSPSMHVNASTTKSAPSQPNTTTSDVHANNLPDSTPTTATNKTTSASSSSSTASSSASTTFASTTFASTTTTSTTSTTTPASSTQDTFSSHIVIDYRRYLVDIALELLLSTKKDELKMNLLIFLQEQCIDLFRDDKILWCFFTTVKALLSNETKRFSSFLRGQMIVTATTILIEIDTIDTNVSLFQVRVQRFQICWLWLLAFGFWLLAFGFWLLATPKYFFGQSYIYE